MRKLLFSILGLLCGLMLADICCAQRAASLVIWKGFEGSFLTVEVNEAVVFQDSVPLVHDPLRPIFETKLPRLTQNYVRISVNQKVAISMPVSMKTLRRKTVFLIQAITFEGIMEQVWLMVLDHKEKFPL